MYPGQQELLADGDPFPVASESWTPTAIAAVPWTCPACTYSHEGESESSYLSCAICGTARPEEAAILPAASPSLDEGGLATAASLLAARVAVDNALSVTPLDRSAAISSLVETSLASRIAQQRQLRSAAKMASRSGVAPPCACCGKGVAQPDRAEIASHVLHRSCMVCGRCGVELGAEVHFAQAADGSTQLLCTYHAPGAAVNHGGGAALQSREEASAGEGGVPPAA